MKHTKFIQDSASAYMIAYNQAMQDTHNPRQGVGIIYTIYTHFTMGVTYGVTAKIQ